MCIYLSIENMFTLKNSVLWKNVLNYAKKKNCYEIKKKLCTEKKALLSILWKVLAVVIKSNYFNKRHRATYREKVEVVKKK